MTDLHEMVALIENPQTPQAQREELISKLNIYGYSEERIRKAALDHWLVYCRAHISTLLRSEEHMESHLLEPEDIKECLEIAFQEYMGRRKDLGIQDIRKYWAP